MTLLSLLLMSCDDKAEACRKVISQVCKAKMQQEIPPEVIERQEAQLLTNCVNYVLELKKAADVDDEQCVADMTRALATYEPGL